MKTKLLFTFLLTSVFAFAQEPTVNNAELSKIEREGQSLCSCAGWQNKKLGDQLESSSWNSSTSFGAKFDDNEADIMYQEVAVLANTDYIFTYYYNFEDKDTDPASSSLEVRILAGSGYDSGYTPTYTTAALEASTGHGYNDIADVENAANNLASETIVAPGDKDFRTGTLMFNSGSNTSIAMFARGIGRPTTAPIDGKSYTWSNAKHEIRIDYVTLLLDTNTASASGDEALGAAFSIYPNPAKDVVTVESADIDVTSVEVYDILGKKVKEVNNTKVDVSSLVSGVYVLKVNTENGSFNTRILVE